MNCVVHYILLFILMCAKFGDSYPSVFFTYQPKRPITKDSLFIK